jgi:ELWxxDGT repeat protein
MARHFVMFGGIDTAGTRGLWVTNGTAHGTYELTGITGAFAGNGQYAGGLSPIDLTVFNGEVLFAGHDTANNVSLWVTGGTAAGTHELTGINGADPAGLFRARPEISES